MVSLKIVLAAGMLILAGAARAGPVDRWAPFIEEAAARFAIPAIWIEQVMAAESGGLTKLGGLPIESKAGAMGLMQLMPGTWLEMRSLHGLGSDPHDPRDNILAGAAYLRAMYDRFGHPGLFAAYNAGPARYARHLATGRPLPAETVAYAARLGGAPAGPRTGHRAPRKADLLFVPLSLEAASGESLDPAFPKPSSGGLFVRLRGVSAHR